MTTSPCVRVCVYVCVRPCFHGTEPLVLPRVVESLEKLRHPLSYSWGVVSHLNNVTWQTLSGCTLTGETGPHFLPGEKL